MNVAYILVYSNMNIPTSLIDDLMNFIFRGMSSQWRIFTYVQYKGFS